MQHVPESPPVIEFIIPAAQPTPDWTETAPKGQLRLQAPHSMQASRLRICTPVGIHNEDFMGTDFKASAAAGAFALVQLEGRYIFEIKQFLHSSSPMK